MLDQFHVPEDIAVYVDPDVMRSTVEDIFVALGMPEKHAEQSADVLLYADVRGIDTHGVSNMLRIYVDRIHEGKINLTQIGTLLMKRPQHVRSIQMVLTAVL